MAFKFRPTRGVTMGLRSEAAHGTASTVTKLLDWAEKTVSEMLHPVEVHIFIERIFRGGGKLIINSATTGVCR